MPGYQAQFPSAIGGVQQGRPGQAAQSMGVIVRRPHDADGQQHPKAARPQLRPAAPKPAKQRPRAPEISQGTIKTGRETYNIVSTLQASRAAGSGMSLGVYAVRDSRSVRCVAKILSAPKPAQKSRAMAEAHALEQIKEAVQSHENVNAIREYFFPEKTPQGTIILEWCNGGSLAAGIDAMRAKRCPMREDLAIYAMFDIAKGLAMIHHGIPDHTRPSTQIKGWNTICHLDIKPPNILLAHDHKDRRPRFIIADFGCSVTKDDIVAGREGKIVQENGTPGWFPPEQPGHGESDAVGRYGKPTDIWQMGGVTQTMCLLLVQPQACRIKMPCGNGYGEELNCLVAMCMSPDYKRRPTAVDVCMELRRVMVKKGMEI